jgi:hypothetical protein
MPEPTAAAKKCPNERLSKTLAEPISRLNWILKKRFVDFKNVQTKSSRDDNNRRVKDSWRGKALSSDNHVQHTCENRQLEQTRNKPRVIKALKLE